MTTSVSTPALRSRVRAGDPLVGVFVKSSSYQVVEVLGRTGLDFVVFDAEHAPFDRNALDVCLLAARANRLPALVRLQNPDPDTVLGVLDMGAEGIMAPHVRSPEGAADIVASTRYRDGTRGFSPSGRAGGYGTAAMADHIAAQDTGTTVMCQIEDAPGVDNVAEIAATDGVDCLFIGRADLTVAYGADDTDDARVAAAVTKICTSGRDAGVPVGMFLPSVAAAPAFRDMGVSVFVFGSDQGLLRSGAGALVGAFHDAVGVGSP
jgi:2-keto-3-deoxy-L-rhamnonate aldolase RhmA